MIVLLVMSPLPKVMNPPAWTIVPIPILLTIFFQLTFNATTTGGGSQYEVVTGANADGTGGTVLNSGGTNFGTAITVGTNSTPPFVANGSSTYAITVRVEGDETCHADYTTSTVSSCSPCSGSPISGTVNLTKINNNKNENKIG